MQSLTTLLSVIVWTLFFASRIHECAATPSQNYLPQVPYIPLSILRFPSSYFYFFQPLQRHASGILFRLEPSGNDGADTRNTYVFSVFFFEGLSCLLIGEQQSNAIRCTSPGNAGRREQGGLKHSLTVKGFH
jgi:hypothetical protein